MQPTPASPQPVAAPSQDEKTMAQIVHFGSIVAPVLLPLVIYLVKKDESKFVAFHALQALFFSLACWVIISMLSAILIGLLLIPVPWIFHLIAGLKVSGNPDYEYPVVGAMVRANVYGR